MFSTVTSAFLSSSLTISSPRGDFKFSVSDFLLALNWWKYQGSLSGLPGCRRRPGSPVLGLSILTTSAPSQARLSVQDGPASNCVKSTTRTPSRQSNSTPRFAMPSSHNTSAPTVPPAGAKAQGRIHPVAYPKSLRLHPRQSHRPSIPTPTHSKGSAAQTSDTHNPSLLRIHELTISTTATPSRLEASISVKPRSNACAAGSPPPVATPYAI